ncbi:hypothetical protein BC629DRAFT_1134636 [Irpex lacteus]|nr:hypothetical protein BC629DRAFT_1134636 [Irpex lacteus]
MGSSNMSYWDAVGLTGARQLLVTSPSGFKSFGSFNALSQDVCTDGSDDIRPFPSRRQVRFSNSIEEFIACSAYEDGIDEDDYVLSVVDNEIQVEPLISES